MGEIRAHYHRTIGANPTQVRTIAVGAALCSIASFIPLVLKVIREHDAEDVSASKYLITELGFALWCAEGVSLKSWPLVVSNFVCLTLAALILALKHKHKNRPFFWHELERWRRIDSVKFDDAPNTYIDNHDVKARSEPKSTNGRYPNMPGERRMSETDKAKQKFQSDLVALIPHMRAFARTLCRNLTEADDLAQDALVKAWAKQDRFTPGTNLKAWTFMILRNHFYSERRRSWRSQPLDQEVAERTLVAVTNPDAAIELDDLRRGLQSLSPEQREALILVGAGGMSYGDASAIMGVAIGTIKSRVSRARAALAAVMSTHDLAKDDVAPSDAMPQIFAQLRDYQRLHAA